MFKYAATLLALAFSGCFDSNPPTEMPGKSSATETPEQNSIAKEVVVSLSLSETHQVDFLKTQDGRYGVSEVGHLDKDGLDRSYLMHLKDGLRMADLYRHLAGSQADSRELEILSRADQEIEISESAIGADPAWNESMEPVSKGPAQADIVSLSDEIRSQAEALGKTAADCSRSSNFWKEDAMKQENCFCDEKSRHCKFNMAQTTSDWWSTKKFTALGLTQDFCIRGRFTVDDYHRSPQFPCGTGAIASGLVTTEVVEPRSWRSVTWTNTGDGGYCGNYYRYFARYKASTGGRGGLVVNPKPGFPDCRTQSKDEKECRARECSWNGEVCLCPK